MAIPHIQNLKENPHHKTKNAATTKLNTENVCPKTSQTLAAGAEDGDVELADTAYMAGRFSLP
jgi:hypothetical protein